MFTKVIFPAKEWSGKMNAMKQTLIVLLLCLPLAAKDKKEEAAKPVVDAKVLADIFKSQRDYANLARQAMPIEIELQHREQDLKAKLDKAQESCGDVAKWKLNSVSGECDAIVPPPPPTPPHACAQGEFNTPGNPCTPAPETAAPEAPKQ